MMKFVIFSLLITSVVASTYKNDFDAFITKYGRKYQNQAEYNKRLAIFETNMKKAAVLTQQNKGSAKFGANEFADISNEEFRASHLMNPEIFRNKKVSHGNATAPVPTATNVAGCNPNSVSYNWLSCGCVGAVRNQQQCGSCWAFSTAETVESYCVLAGGQLQPLSVQQIVDCDQTDQGCNGGLPSNAYEYIEEAGGLETESAYPYTAENGQCQFNQQDVVCTVTGYQNINGETGLYQQTSSSNGGPVSVCVDASSWQTYTGGVLTSCTSNIDHCVQLTGYANYGENGAYWIVRNSWGTSWGEAGYIWVAIGQDLCAIGDEATVPSVKVISGTTGNSGSTGGNSNSNSGNSQSTGEYTSTGSSQSTGSTNDYTSTGNSGNSNSGNSQSTGSTNDYTSTGSSQSTGSTNDYTSTGSTNDYTSTGSSSVIKAEEVEIVEVAYAPKFTTPAVLVAGALVVVLVVLLALIIARRTRSNNTNLYI